MVLDRKRAPGFVKSTSFDLIAPDVVRLPNGIDLFFIHGGSQDVIKIELLFDAGKWYDTKWGASYFTSNQLSKGTKQKSSFDIASIFDRYGAHFEIHPGLDTVSLSLYALTKHLSPVIALLQEILLEPTFPEKELEQSKLIYTQNLKVNLEKTSFLASKHFRKSLFGDDHPYGNDLEETDVLSLQQNDLTRHFSACFQYFTVFVSGKFDTLIQQEIEKIFSHWKVKKSPQKEISRTAGKPVHQHIEKEGSIQSSVRMGVRSLLRSHPEYAKAIFVSHVLGGYFGSRLMKNIREEKGLTYGIHASIHALKNDSYLVIGADVNKENVQLTFDEIRKELRRLRAEALDPDELETARNHFIGSLQSELTTPFAHADKLKTIYLFGLPSDYYQQMITSIEQLNHAEIMRISDQYFHEEQFFEIAVG